MLNVVEKIITLLKNDSTLASLMSTSTPIKNLYTGAVDVAKETQSELGFPLLIVTGVSESFRSVPLNSRDSRITVDIYSRNNEMEVQTIYERIAALLNYTFGDINSSHVFWQRSDGATSQFEAEFRIWHWSVDFIIWSD